MAKIAMFGGTFNPIHNGHLCLARTFLSRLHLDQVLLIPTGTPPHKRYLDAIPSEDRFQMCLLAVQEEECLQASDIEIRRRGASYTVDTLRQIAAQHPEDELYLITGGDMFLTIQDWKEAQEIMRLAIICGVPRNRDDFAVLRYHEKELQHSFHARTVVLDMPLMPISSTEIRNKVYKGESIRGLVPDQVEDYIIKHKLYTERSEIT